MRTDPESVSKGEVEGAVPADYVERVNRAIDYILGNLSGPLKLEQVSQAACFSPFHFHRVFKGLIGETLSQFVKRQRLERALYLMSHAPNLSSTDVVLDCGFSSSSDFSRSFKQRFGVAPSRFDLGAYRETQRAEFEQVLLGQKGGPRLPRLPAG